MPPQAFDVEGQLRIQLAEANRRHYYCPILYIFTIRIVAIVAMFFFWVYWGGYTTR
ncbi:hypothetical protein BDZ45DRAFT_680329 [Acephala macrosclerotiorum]|nr:hypothetical protein BDZ45DRAFT_680329 [Acephala macrosclerotiorum]